MKGKHRIIVQNKRLRYDFEIQRKQKRKKDPDG